MIERLLKANLDIIQISVDRKTPSDVTKKALDLLGPIIENLRKTAIKLHISGVICADTIDEAESVLRYGLEHDIPTELRLMHGDLAGNPKTDPVSHERGRELLDLQVRLKQAGQKVHTTNMILDYQLDTLAGKDIHWKCLAGYKIFFVSADGYFWPCSLLKSDKRIEDITPADLLAYNSVKDCQPKCGIYCAVSNSLFLEQPAQFILREIPARLKQTLRQRRD
jgi:MoaA/NifB/PqqE/SkfB family radical SAM enzyme